MGPQHVEFIAASDGPKHERPAGCESGGGGPSRAERDKLSSRRPGRGRLVIKVFTHPRIHTPASLSAGRGLDRQGLLDRARACAAAAPSAKVLATGIRTLDDLEAALHGGFEMAAGLFDRVGSRRESGSLAPNIERICRLINQVMSDADTGPIAEEIRGDVAMTYSMLRHANSPLLGLTRRVDSVDQALQFMGRQALYRWLTTLLVASATSRHTSVALQEITLARARMMEQVAHLVDGPPAALFTTGLLSLLDVMLEVPMAEALAPLSLPPEAHAALVEHSGPWRPLIDVARCLESGQTEQAAMHAQRLGGLQAVGPAMTEAWQWAAQVTASMKQP